MIDMMSGLWRVDVAKYGTTDVIAKKWFVAGNFFQLSHLVQAYIYEDEMFSFPVEIVAMNRLQEVDDIVNVDFNEGSDDDEEDDWDENEPFKVVDNIAPEQVMTFKCKCNEEIKVANYNWPFIKCPECHIQINRSEVQDVGGIFVYIPNKPNKPSRPNNMKSGS